MNNLQHFNASTYSRSCPNFNVCILCFYTRERRTKKGRIGGGANGAGELGVAIHIMNCFSCFSSLSANFFYEKIAFYYVSFFFPNLLK